MLKIGEGNGTPFQYSRLENPWTEEPGRLQSMGSVRVGHDWATSLSHIGEGNGNPFQCSCLENPRDGGAWWAAVYGIAQGGTWLKWLSNAENNITLIFLASKIWLSKHMTWIVDINHNAKKLQIFNISYFILPPFISSALCS